MIGGLAGFGFAAPGLLLGLLALPVIWLILRAVPPAPIRQRFPAVALLLGLGDDTVHAVRTPPWLLLLRVLALAALIVGFAGPVLNPDPQPHREGPLLVVVEGGWAQADAWPTVSARLDQAVDSAIRDGRPLALLNMAAPQAGSQPAPIFVTPDRAAVAGLVPRPWLPVADPLPALPDGAFETLWLASGVDFPGRAALAQALAARGKVTVLPPLAPVVALSAPRLDQGALAVTVQATGPVSLRVQAMGPDPAGVQRALADQPVTLAAGALRADLRFDLPVELRNRVTRLQVAGLRSAGAVALGDDLLRRRKVALSGGGTTDEAQALLSPLHYVRQALAPQAELIAGAVDDLLDAGPDVLILTDIANPPETERIIEWVEDGGLLIRFAGPNMTRAADPMQADPLIPVRLRPGDRSIGGALSWGAPRRIAPFARTGPFAGLTPPEETQIRAQLVAEPGPDLAARTLAELEDGTPLVTRAELGQGQVVLFHVTANADWSNLPISGLFVQMLDRLVAGAGAGDPAARAGLAGRSWQPTHGLDGFGVLSETPAAEPVDGALLAGGAAGPLLPPGLYLAAPHQIAVNAMAPDQTLQAAADWPAGVTLDTGPARPPRALGGWLIALGLGLLALDVLASLAVGGRLRRAAVLLAGLAILSPEAPQAQDTDLAAGASLPAAYEVSLAHIATGDAQVDETTRRGLQGLSDVLAARTTIEPGPPITVNPETDDLSLLTLIYWPVTEGQPAPSPRAYARLNRFLASGGMILFDTRDGDLAGLGGEAGAGVGGRLRDLAAPLDIPALEPVPADHVLTRSFYLLDDFPGRHAGAPLWVEARPVTEPGAETASLNDGVTPVIIGGGDWAAAWAVDDRALPLNAVGRGLTGERQREMAYRFGVNLVMHVLTGNYKADQLHVAEILERLEP